MHCGGSPLTTTDVGYYGHMGDTAPAEYPVFHVRLGSSKSLDTWSLSQSVLGLALGSNDQSLPWHTMLTNTSASVSAAPPAILCPCELIDLVCLHLVCAVIGTGARMLGLVLIVVISTLVVLGHNRVASVTVSPPGDPVHRYTHVVWGLILLTFHHGSRLTQ